MGMRVHWQSSNDLVALASMSADVQALVQQVLQGRIKPTEMARRQAQAAAEAVESTDGAAAT
jgi:enoyl-CoA hydratase